MSGAGHRHEGARGEGHAHRLALTAVGRAVAEGAAGHARDRRAVLAVRARHVAVDERRGVELPLPPQATSTPDTRRSRGVEVRERIVGVGSVEQALASSSDDERHIQELLSANCFGDRVSRAGVDLAPRELLTFSMLISLGGCEPQAKGHVAAHANVGNDRAVLLDVITQLLPFVGYPRTLDALRVLNEVRAS